MYLLKLVLFFSYCVGAGKYVFLNMGPGEMLSGCVFMWSSRGLGTWVKAVKLLTRIHRWFCVIVTLLPNNLVLNMWDEIQPLNFIQQTMFQLQLATVINPDVA